METLGNQTKKQLTEQRTDLRLQLALVDAMLERISKQRRELRKRNRVDSMPGGQKFMKE
jgi:energy-converting hydrogenase A subunit M